MHKFDYINQIKELYTPKVVSAICYLCEHKGKQELFMNTKPEVLQDMKTHSNLNSLISSNRIEGIEVPKDKATKIANCKLEPKTRCEQEVAGYKKVLDMIHSDWNAINITPNVILQLHRDMYSYSDVSFKGEYKSTDNAIVEIDAKGNRRIRFKPVSAVSTPVTMDDMCKSFNEAWQDEDIDKLLLSMMFVLDFLCVHPFIDGNGRLSRLITLLLLYKCGFIVGQYISIEKIIEQSRETYYESLKFSSEKWHSARPSYKDFIDYMLGVITAAYGSFENILNNVNSCSKSNAVENVMCNTLGKVTKEHLREKCPGISDITIQRTLEDLQKQNKIEKYGAGRYTYYVSRF